MISEKQKKILAFQYSNYEALICDGAVRSGKTSIMMWAFVSWAMNNFNGKRFGICGKTVDSAIKNVITPFASMTLANETYFIKWRKADHILEVTTSKSSNQFEVFGGKDESSFMLIQGRTLAGVLLDEVALMPESFVNQALARCSIEGSKFWFNCNPSNPYHWFYKNWILKSKYHNALYLHFTMYDNPSLSESTLKRYETMYAGVFYQRYIKGLWVSAEGLIYDLFSETKHVLNELPELEHDFYISCDFGIRNANVFLFWQREKQIFDENEKPTKIPKWICTKEIYYSGRENQLNKTVTQLVNDLMEELGKERPEQIIVDPSATALIEELRQRDLTVIKADNDVFKGITDVRTLLGLNYIAFNKTCENTIKEFGIYAWDEKASQNGEDKPVKVSDHCMDAIRYFVRTKHIVRRMKGGE